MPGQRLGQYELQSQLGAPSGMGSVYAALDTELNREVAIKELLPHLSRDREFSARFRAEAANHARLNHPNITTLYSLGHDGESEFMVMELVRGYTLRDAMKRQRQMGLRESLAVVAQAAAGLAYAHRMGVIHRDIKPPNIMITHEGVLKIMDFGISRARGSQRQTRDGGIVGTLLYISPEQLRSGEGDERSDIYSLAITLYEMLTGHPPFKADSEYELMRLHLEAIPDPLAVHLPRIDPQLDAAVLRALAKNPEDRFATIDAFSRATGAAVLQNEAADILRLWLNAAFDPEVTIIDRSPPITRGSASRPTAASAAPSGAREAPSIAFSPAPAPAPSLAQTPPSPSPPPARSRLLLPAVFLGTVLILLAAVVGYVLLAPQSAIVRTEPAPGVSAQGVSAQGVSASAGPAQQAPAAPARQASPSVLPPPPLPAPEPEPAPVLAMPAPTPSTPPSSVPPSPVIPPVASLPTPSPAPASLPAPLSVSPPPPSAPPVAPPAASSPPPVQAPSPTPRLPEAPPSSATKPPVASPVGSLPPPSPAPSPPAPSFSAAAPPVVPPGATLPPPAQPQSVTKQPAPATPPAPNPPKTDLALNVPPPSVPSPAAPVEPPAVEGMISAAAGTHALVIGGKFVTLFGVEPHPQGTSQFNEDRLIMDLLVRGIVATCYARPQNRFQCTSQKGEDLAVLALKVGVVRPAQNAPAEYHNIR